MGFLLSHREHEARGPMLVRYERSVRATGRALRITLHSRGDRYELTPPVPVEIMPGRVRGRAQRALRGLFPPRPTAHPVSASAMGATFGCM